MEAVWNDDGQRWKVPDLLVEKTKLPPAGNPLSRVRIRPLPNMQGHVKTSLGNQLRGRHDHCRLVSNAVFTIEFADMFAKYLVWK